MDATHRYKYTIGKKGKTKDIEQLDLPQLKALCRMMLSEVFASLRQQGWPCVSKKGIAFERISIAGMLCQITLGIFSL